MRLGGWEMWKIIIQLVPVFLPTCTKDTWVVTGFQKRKG